MRPSALVYMYARRLRAHGIQEALAALGIAIAVALVLSATLAELSISSSARTVLHTVVGPAQLQLRARSGEGVDEALLARVQRLPGVVRTAPLFEQSATLASPRHNIRVSLAGADLRLATLDGLGETLPLGTLTGTRIALSAATAHALGMPSGTVTLMLRGGAYPLHISAVLDSQQAGALSGALVAMLPLATAQRLAGLPHRVTRILVQAAPGHTAQVRRELRALAAGAAGTGGLEVAAADQDLALLRQALGPSDLASGLFAAIGALLGFLLAFNAMLLTVPYRRRTIADLRIEGATRLSIFEMVAFEALCLGAVGSLAGVLAGWGLASGVFHQSTGYLAQAFTLSPNTLLNPSSVALALAGGVLATLLASTLLLLDLRPGRARDAIYRVDGEPGNTLTKREQLRLGAASTGLLAAATCLWTLAPATAIPATALLALATVLAVPLVFAAVLRAAATLAEHAQRIAILPLALASLRATTVRSLALAATGAVALFGSVALGGARENLLQGIHSFAHSYVSDASIWVGNRGDNQAVDTFRAAPPPAGLAPTEPSAARSTYAARIARVSSVAGVSAFHGGFLQLGGRRVWVIARPPGGASHVLATQLRAGSFPLVLSRLAGGGWVAVSEAIATERHLHLGDALTLPTPSGPRPFRIAATTTNLAWPPGVVFMSSADFARDWRSSNPTALAVSLRPGADPRAAREQIARALGPASGLEVALAADRAKRIDTLAGEGLGQLRQIALLLLVAATLAMAAALASSIWQRRAGLAGLRLLGARAGTVLGVLALEALLILGAGCLTGALAGVYGQVVIDAFLRHVTGFPLADPTTSAHPLQIFALVLAAALAIGAIPAWLAARVRPALALAGE